MGHSVVSTTRVLKIVTANQGENYIRPGNITKAGRLLNLPLVSMDDPTFRSDGRSVRLQFCRLHKHSPVSPVTVNLT